MRCFKNSGYQPPQKNKTPPLCEKWGFDGMRAQSYAKSMVFNHFAQFFLIGEQLKGSSSCYGLGLNETQLDKIAANENPTTWYKYLHHRSCLEFRSFARIGVPARHRSRSGEAGGLERWSIGAMGVLFLLHFVQGKLNE